MFSIERRENEAERRLQTIHTGKETRMNGREEMSGHRPRENQIQPPPLGTHITGQKRPSKGLSQWEFTRYQAETK